MQPQLVYIRVPKTGSTSLAGYILSHVGNENSAIFHTINKVADKENLNFRINEFNEWLNDQEAHNRKFIHGHIPYFPILNSEIAEHSLQFITQIRDPLSNLLSAYRIKAYQEWEQFIPYDGTNYEATPTVELEETKPKESFSDFIRNQPGIDDYQTRWIFGKKMEAAEAIDILDSRFLVCGLLENFPETISQLAAHMDWPNDLPPKDRITPIKPDSVEVTDKDRQFIRSQSSVDYALWEYAQSRGIRSCR